MARHSLLQLPSRLFGAWKVEQQSNGRGVSVITDQEVSQSFSDNVRACGGVKEDYFGLLFLEREHNVPHARALNQIAFGGNDYGLDGFNFDEAKRNLYLFQFKYTGSYSQFKGSMQRLIESGIHRIFKSPNEDDSKNQVLMQLRSCLIENRSLIDQVCFRFVFTGDPNEAERSMVLDKLREDLENKRFLVEQFFQPRPVRFVVEFRSSTGKIGGLRSSEKSAKFSIRIDKQISAEASGGEKLIHCAGSKSCAGFFEHGRDVADLALHPPEVDRPALHADAAGLDVNVAPDDNQNLVSQHTGCIHRHDLCERPDMLRPTLIRSVWPAGIMIAIGSRIASLSVCQVKTVSGRCVTAPTPSMRVYGAPLLVDGSPRRRIGSQQDAMVGPPLELPDNFCRHMSKKTPCRRCLLGIQLYIVGYSDTVDWRTKRPERRVSKPHPSSCLHVLRFCMLGAAMVSWPFSVDADTGRPFVVIVPPVRPPSPPERAIPAQPAFQWAPPFAMGLTPGLRSPTARCYAGANVCPLMQPEHIGESCTCGIEGRPLPGRALIPPSHDISSMLRRTD